MSKIGIKSCFNYETKRSIPPDNIIAVVCNDGILRKLIYTNEYFSGAEFIPPYKKHESRDFSLSLEWVGD